MAAGNREVLLRLRNDSDRCHQLRLIFFELVFRLIDGLYKLVDPFNAVISEFFFDPIQVFRQNRIAKLKPLSLCQVVNFNAFFRQKRETETGPRFIDEDQAMGCLRSGSSRQDDRFFEFIGQPLVPGIVNIDIVDAVKMSGNRKIFLDFVNFPVEDAGHRVVNAIGHPGLKRRIGFPQATGTEAAPSQLNRFMCSWEFIVLNFNPVMSAGDLMVLLLLVML